MIVLWNDTQRRRAAEQMAVDRAQLDHTSAEGTGILRIYRWQSPAISFGANESTQRHWQRELIEHDRIDTVRRPTGGRAVWHDPDDLTYSMTVPLGLFQGQQQAYRTIHERMATALDQLAATTRIAPPPPRLPGLSAGSCFDTAIGGEVLVGGRKAIGSAQLVLGKTLLQHGEIARGERRGALARFARNGETVTGGAAVPDLPGAEEIAAAITAIWLAEGVGVIDPALSSRLLLASTTFLPRFDDVEWTWRR